MIRNALAAMASLAVLVLAAPRPSLAADRAADEKAILKLENAWTAAILARDIKALEAILADDWVGNGSYGSVTRAQTLADLKSGDYKVDSLTAPHDVKVRFLGDVAIVTGASEEKSTWKGKDLSGSWVWMDVWAKRKGKWQAVASQGSLIPAK